MNESKPTPFPPEQMISRKEKPHPTPWQVCLNQQENMCIPYYNSPSATIPLKRYSNSILITSRFFQHSSITETKKMSKILFLLFHLQN